MATKAIRDKLNVTSPAELDGWLNMFVYGEPGVGKTRLASTAQDHEDTRPVLFIDVEGGTATFRNRKDIDIVAVRNIKELVNVQNELFKDEEHYYKTVVLDSLSEIQKLDMIDIMQKAYNKNPEKVDKEVPSQREYLKSLTHMREIVRSFRDLPCNTILTAHSATEKNDGEPTLFFPGLPGKQQKEIPGFLDCVGYYYIAQDGNELIRRLQFEKTRRILAKDRFDAFVPYVDNPTVPLLWQMLHDKMDEDKKETK